MDVSFLSIGLNIILMILLGAMIFYARRLSDSISIFRNSRKDMELLIKDLSRNVDKAEAAIKSMRKETDTSADDLHFMITKARALSEELQFIQETGDRLANRLEKAVEKQSELRPQFELEEEPSAPAASRKSKDKEEKKRQVTPPRPMFNIIDREFDAPSRSRSPDEFDENSADLDVPEDLTSQAERDLILALQRQTKNKKG
ncbi:MAG: hypothetical protein H6855_02720 [Rhodospirillales bacterium]|nr:hypothetical protein [Rhodospirillales bacterium]MCB9964979.1 hypothetical protein [Rhodospirillales bacterium]MCB9973429.1 hypothetical protein [Rhodospirillales bacterium]MCB9980432.1 hypothetical protein [Rhodospirillales bacterium]